MKKRVSAKQFCRVFTRQWMEDSRNKRDAILRAWPGSTTWTEYIPGTKERCKCPKESNGNPPLCIPCQRREESFLGRLPRKLCLRRSLSEWYTLDAVYYAENQRLHHGVLGCDLYPTCMHVIVEHENDKRVEEEMSKLAIVRSPLKVLIFYDHHGVVEYAIASPEQRTWLAEKLEQLFGIGEDIEASWSEGRGTEYLFLIGDRDGDGQIPFWRYCVVKAGRFGRMRRRLKRKGEGVLRRLC